MLGGLPAPVKEAQASPGTIWVPDNYSTIQAAVNASSPGDTIIVRNGTYNENVVVGKRLTIQSEKGAANCIVSASNPHAAVFYVTADYVNITGFTVRGATGEAGIRVGIDFGGHASGCTIFSNNIINNYYGIQLNPLSNNATITSNTISNNYHHGIFLLVSSNNTLTGNTMVNDGIFLDGYSLEQWNTHTIDTSNKVNGKPVYYWKNVTGGVVPAGVGQVILANCSNVEVSSQNVSYASTGIELGFSDHCIITSNTALNNFNSGIYLDHSNNNTIRDNTISNSSVYGGIYLFSSSSNTITNNTLSNDGVTGIGLSSSSNNTLTGNTMVNDGIALDGDSLEQWNTHTIDTSNKVNGKPVYYWKNVTGGVVPGGAGQVILANCSNVEISNQNVGYTPVELGFSDHCIITSNTVSNSDWGGIYLDYSSSNTLSDNILLNNDFMGGIYLGDSSNNTITNNTVSGSVEGIDLWDSSNNTLTSNTASNNFYGIYLCYRSDNNTITGNTASNNSYCGIYLNLYSNNTIYLNNFINNTDNVDSSDSTNTWNSIEKITYTYKGSNYTNYLGNYWSDYTGSDPDGDGIGNSPYSIGGDNPDNYPLMEPFENGGGGTALEKFWVVVNNTGSTLAIRQNPGTSEKLLKRVPDGWVLNVTNTHQNGEIHDGYVWWEMEDVTDGITGWSAYQNISDGTKYLSGDKNNQSEQNELGNKTSLLATNVTRVPVILEAVNHYYNNEDTTSSLYSSKDKSSDGTNNNFPMFKNGEFPIELILAMIAQESSGVKFDNELVSGSGGYGIMQITGNRNRGWGSRLNCSAENCKYYTNTPQGIYADIKDGLRVLQYAYQSASNNHPDNVIEDAVWRYNHGGNDKIGDPYYLKNVANKLQNLTKYFGEGYKTKLNADQLLNDSAKEALIEKLISYQETKCNSPVELRIYDSQGNVTGLVNGEPKNEISNSDYYTDVVIVFSPCDSYRYEIVGTEEGVYGLEATSVKDGEAAAVTAIDVPTSPNATHNYTINWTALSLGEKSVTIEIDSNGDGVIDDTVLTTPSNTPGSPSPSNGTDNIPLSSTLSWNGSDPDGDNLTYYVYFGTDEDPPLVSENQTGTSYSPSLNYNTTYYWHVVSRDEHGIAAEGPVWTFTTSSEQKGGGGGGGGGAPPAPPTPAENVSEEVAPPTPANFVPSSLTISSTEVRIGEMVEISILVTNAGGQSGSYQVVLKINGVVEETKEITIAPDESKVVSFTTSRETVGNYSVEVNGLEGSFTVKELPSKGVNRPLVGGIVGGIIVLGVLGYFLVSRGKRARPTAE